ncbi:MAG: efflux transporter, family, subunit [Phenylobacterium sp.]|nr:efflux transporter, family, subunit [Phenylobacterium sp.]
MSHFGIRLLIAAVLAATLTGCGKPSGPPPQGPPEVGVVVLQPQPASIQTELPGRTSAVETSDVRPQVSGLIEGRLFTEGSTVKRGQLLYQIDPAPYRAAYAQANGQLANARAMLTTARLKSERYADLVKFNAVSHQEADDAAAAYGQASAQVQQAQAAVESARINLGYTRVTAPISGRIGRSTVTRGALVTANQATALTTIQRLDTVYVDINQSAGELLALQRSVRSGKIAPGPVTVRLRLEDGSDYDRAGVLAFSDVTVDQSTGAVTLRAVFPNPMAVLLPGMYVKAVVPQGVVPSAILAPQVGVTRDERGLPTAMVVDAQGKAQQRTLTTGPAIGDKWLVTSGLTAGDRLIVEGLQKVKAGAPVRPVPAGSPRAPPVMAAK